MSEVIITFQSQLSGVMETVFKAAMFEITRLVEDSFLEEVSRSREQVESLKKRLQLFENRRKDRDNPRRTRCVNCGKADGTSENPVDRSGETQSNRGSGLKQEKSHEDGWNSCSNTEENSFNAIQPETAAGSTSGDVDITTGRVKEYSQRKEETLRNVQEHSDKWSMCMEEGELFHSSSSKCVSGEELGQCRDEWEAEPLSRSQDPGPDRETEGPQGLRYSMDELGHFETSYNSQDLDMGDLRGLSNSPAREEDAVGFRAMQTHLPGDFGVMEESSGRTHASSFQKGRRSTLRSHGRSPAELSCGNASSADLNYLLINEDGCLENTSTMYQHGDEDGQREHGLLPSSSSLVHPEHEQMYAGDPYSHAALPSTDGVAEHGGEARLHTCSQCLISFPDARSLKSHMQSHRAASSSRYSCNQCGKTFTQACNLKVHQRIHQGEGLHLCSHCGKGFPSSGDLQKHQCSHAVDKPYCCSLCGNKFSRLWNLKLHQRIHTQEKPHSCTLCDKSFTRADILKVHYRTHTGERPYSCTVCGLSFKRLDHLKSHQRKHRPDFRN